MAVEKPKPHESSYKLQGIFNSSVFSELTEHTESKMIIFTSGPLQSLRACLHGGGGPQVGEVTRLAVVEKWPAFTCKLTTPGSRGDFT